MKLLLDTHALIWHHENSGTMPKRVKDVINDKNNLIFISVVNIWEISIKIRAERLKLSIPTEKLLAIWKERGAYLVAVTPAHALAVETLPLYHRDPFDRMLIIQAMTGKFSLITKDEKFKKYPVECIW